MLSSSASAVKRGLLASAQTSGINRIIGRSQWRTRRLLILCYHGVSLQDEHVWDPELFVTPAFLARRLQLLAEARCNVLPLGSAVRLLSDGRLPPRSVVMTFDDGFYNMVPAAAPLLRKFGVPATVYVSTYHSLHQRPLLRLSIRFLLWRARHLTISAEEFGLSQNLVVLSNTAEREKLAAALYDGSKRHCANTGEQMQWLGQLAERLGIDWNAFLASRLFHLMTPDEISDLAADGVDIQLHTHRHRTPRDRTSFCEEIAANRRYLTDATGVVPNHLCYPSGDYDQAFVPWLTDMGVLSATTCEAGLAVASDNPLLLPRFVDTMTQSESAFLAWLSGAAEFLARSPHSRAS